MGKRTKKARATAPAAGERAAIGGYHPQYRLSADVILLSLRHETLEWIRLADPHAGRVDDFQIATPGRVDAYQVKWSRDGGNFTFRDLTAPEGDAPCLIAQLADGWKRLRQRHSNRRVVVHLRTNEIPSVSKLLERADGTKGSFSEFLNQSWCSGNDTGAIPSPDWQSVWDILIRTSTLSASDFAHFRNDCKLEFGIALPGKTDGQTIPDPIYQRDLRQLTEFVQAVVADPSNVIELFRGQLLDQVGWANRLTYVSRHEFPDPTIPYREIAASADQLRVALQTLNRGYVALLGDPGSGKSTLLTKTLLALPYRVIRYYAFVPDAPDPRALRGEASSFLHDLTLSLDRAGFRHGASLSEVKDADQLAQRLHQQLQLLHQEWQRAGCKTVILVDGLDHIPRELKPQNSLLRYLPHPDQIPDGVLVVMGSQTDHLAELPSSIHYSIQHTERRILIERLSRHSVVEIVQGAQLPSKLTSDQQAGVEGLAAGHPLALALLINRLKETSEDQTVDDVLTSTEPFGGQIDAVYHSQWRQVIDERQDDELAEVLGKIVRLRPTIELDWVESWAGKTVVSRLRRNLNHLFRRESRDRWFIFHNSFRLFLLRRTAESPPDGFDEARDRRIHSEIADLCAAEPVLSHWNWEEAYHRNRSEDHDTTVQLANAARLRAQLLAFRTLDAIQGDIRIAVASAGVLRDFVELTRLLFVGVEFAAREQSMSFTSFHECLLDVGDVEKACAHVRDGRRLTLNNEPALDFSLRLVAQGCNDEARTVFELAEPIDLLKNGRAEHDLHDERVTVLSTWANVAVSFRPLAEVVKLIRGTRQHVATLNHDVERSESILQLQNHMLVHAGYGLIAANDWSNLDRLFDELGESNLPGLHEQFWLCVKGWNACRGDQDTAKARTFVERASSLLPLAELSASETTRLAEGILRILGDGPRGHKLFSTVPPPALTTDPGLGDRLDPYMQRFRYNRLLYAFGEQRSPTELIPDASETHHQGAVYFERGLSEVARVWAMLWRGVRLDGPMFVQEVRPLLLLFCRDWNSDDGRPHWSFLTRHRSRFYPLLVRAARAHGTSAIRELASAFEREWFESERSRYWPLDDVRSITRTLFQAGVGKEWCRAVLERTEVQSSDATDTNERISWRASQAESWALIGEPDRAKENLSEMLRLSAGIGYRKDYQLDSWIAWMRRVNRIEPAGAEERLRFMASAVISLIDSTEGRAASSAAALLLEATFEWSPLRAVSLCKLLSENGAISYASGAAVVVAQALESESPACELCLAYCRNVLVPICTASEGPLAATLIRRCAEVHGEDHASRAAQSLAEAVMVHAIPETRAGWLRGIAEGCRVAGVTLQTSASEFQAETDDADESSVWLTLTDGRRLSRRDLSSQIQSSADLFSLIDAEASDSYFDWTSTIGDVAKRLDTEQVVALADALVLRRRETMGLAALSERLHELGDHERAWAIGLKALQCAHEYGWDRHYDGGSVQVAFRGLANVDPERARTMAFESLVSHLTRDRCHPLSTALNWDAIAPIVCETVPTRHIWPVIEEYLQAVFSELPDTIATSVLEVEGECLDSSPRALSKLSIEYLGHPAHFLSQGAVRACVEVLLQGCEVIRDAIRPALESADGRTSDALIALDAVCRTDPEMVRSFSEEISALRISPDQSFQWTAQRIARQLGLPPSECGTQTDVVGRYQDRVIVPGAEPLHGRPEESSFDILPDSVDPYELVAIWRTEVEAIAKCARLPLEGVLMRVVEFMRTISPESPWDAEAERELRRRMDNADLEFPFRRPRSSQSRRAVYHVLAELADGGRIPAEDLVRFELICRTYDVDLVLRSPATRPDEIGPVVRPEHNEFEDKWVKEVHSGEIRPFCELLGNRVVVAESTSLKPAGTRMPSELRKSSLCLLEADSATMDGAHFFPPLIRELVSTYHEVSRDLDGSLTVVHWDYGYDTPGGRWLALNPSLGRSLQWERSEGKLLAWEKNGQTMVETIWWTDGSLDHSMPFYRKCEVGEGWLVLATQEAIGEIVGLHGGLKRVTALTREIVKGRERLCETATRECEWPAT